MKILVLGAGSIGRRHIQNLRTLGHSALRVSDPDPARVEAAAALGAEAAASLEAGLADHPDLVVVASPTHLHVEQARTAAAAGCHLFIEKPLGASMEGVSGLEAEVSRTGVHVMVGCNSRFDRVYRCAKQVLDEGVLGDVHGARIYFGHDLAAWRPTVDVQRVYSAHRAQGGGIALDAIHELDLAHWWFGPVRRTAAMCRGSGRFNDIEDVAHFTLEHDRGVVTHLDLNCLDPFYRRGASIAGSRAVCDADFAARKVVVRTREGAERVHEFADSDRNEMYVEELRHFIAVVRGEQAPIVSLRDGIENLALTLSMREAGMSAIGASGE